MNHTRLLYVLACALCASLSCAAQLSHTEAPQGKTRNISRCSVEPTKSTTLSYTVTQALNGTFGYDILMDGKLYVRQVNIPGRPGNNGCATEADAVKLAQLVIGKIQRGVMPPTVTEQELTAMNIIR